MMDVSIIELLWLICSLLKLFLWIKDAFNPVEETNGSAGGGKSNRTESVDLNNTNDASSGDFLKIEISDALNEKDKVKFTIKTKVITWIYSFEGHWSKTHR